MVPSVSQKHVGKRPMIDTSPVHMKYTTSMRGVDVVNYLRSSYSSQVQIHKW